MEFVRKYEVECERDGVFRWDDAILGSATGSGSYCVREKRFPDTKGIAFGVLFLRLMSVRKICFA